MAISPKEGKLLYHLTSVENLDSIFLNGLAPRKQLTEFADVAEPAIIDHRESLGLNEFVPFHFFAGTPFDGIVQKIYTEKEFVFITLHRSFAASNGFKILTQHPLSLTNCIPLSYAEGMDAIDWETMKTRDYKDNLCSNICMAECLSPKKIEPSDFYIVFVRDLQTKSMVEQLRDKMMSETAFHVGVNSNFFVK